MNANIKIIEYKGDKYLISNDPPKNDDLVLTDHYEIWIFKEKSSMLPFWCNAKACKKLILIQS